MTWRNIPPILSPMMLMDSLLQVADRYIAVGRPASLSGLGMKIANDHKFLLRIKAGAACSIPSYEKAMTWLSENWPEGAEWPEGVARPDPKDVAA